MINGNVFSQNDLPIITAFCDRESHQYRWGEPDGEKRRKEFVDRSVQTLMSHTEERPGFNFARIQSLTNMGQLQDELVLSTQHLDVARGDIKFFFPPSPRGGIGVSRND